MTRFVFSFKLTYNKTTFRSKGVNRRCHVAHIDSVSAHVKSNGRRA